MKKGGYQIIDLKDYNITTDGVTIKGIYDDISTNKRKVILLSGVTIKGVEFSDMFVKVVRAEDDFRLTGYSVSVDGTLSTYDFFVEDDDTVTLIEDEVSGGSGEQQLFKAVYGETTFNEVVEALTADKLVIAVQNSEVYIFGNLDSTNGIMVFYNVTIDGGTNTNYLKTLYLTDGDVWNNSAIDLYNLMNNPMTAMGDLIVGSINGVPGRIARGTLGQVLTMGASFPEWQTPSSGGAEHLYWHSIYIGAGSNFTGFCVILNTSSEQFTREALFDMLGSTEDAVKVLVTGGSQLNSGDNPLYLTASSESSAATNGYIELVYNQTSAPSTLVRWKALPIKSQTSVPTFTDSVTQIF